MRSIVRLLRRFIALFLVGLVISVALAACAPSSSPGGANKSESNPRELTLVSYAVTQAAYEKIIPAFTAKWQKEHKQAITFNQSYGGSGSQTRAVIDGLEADVVALALALDTKKIEKAGLIQSGWEQKLPNQSIIHTSVAALVTREGNPKGIKSWADLAKPDLKIVTANPKTSGGARWNFMALWGSVSQTGGNDAKAQEYTTNVFKNVPILPRDAREATDVFYTQNQGDVLINYENEVLLAQQKGKKLPFIVPTDVNVSIDSPVAVVDTNVDKHGTRAIAEAFVQYLFTPEAQQEFAKVGFRPVDSAVAQEVVGRYPKIAKLFSAKDLGGWDKIQAKFFDDGAIFDQIQSKIGKA
jgi:sulfate/thiosulfate transport system substrate-binding protein